MARDAEKDKTSRRTGTVAAQDQVLTLASIHESRDAACLIPLKNLTDSWPARGSSLGMTVQEIAIAPSKRSISKFRLTPSSRCR